VKFTISDSKAEVCDATGTSGTLTAATGTASFTGFGAPNNLGTTANTAFSPSPIPANGVATSSITVCVRDAAPAYNKVTSGTGSTDSISLLKLTGTATTLLTSNPQTAAAGCASFTVQATTTVGTDTYRASDNSRTGIATLDVSINTVP
jgi:hypothetical protein